jgi:hypothetical protein
MKLTLDDWQTRRDHYANQLSSNHPAASQKYHEAKQVVEFHEVNGRLPRWAETA